MTNSVPASCPVCNQGIAPGQALEFRLGYRVIYACSDGCRLAAERMAHRRAIEQVPPGDRALDLAFHDRFYRNFRGVRWLGVETLKCPMDLLVLQEVIWDVRPDLIVEAGTWLGGSALFMAMVLDALGRGDVVSIDVNNGTTKLPSHPRVSYRTGSSADPGVVPDVAGRKVMVVLDSDHQAAHVLEELRLWAPLVSLGSYLVVEDTNINGHPARPEFGPGPAEAVAEFLGTEQGMCFEADVNRERLLLTFNPGGWLRRVRTTPPAACCSSASSSPRALGPQT